MPHHHVAFFACVLAIAACGKGAAEPERPVVDGGGPTPPTPPTPPGATPDAVAPVSAPRPDDLLAEARWGVADDQRAVMLITLTDPEDRLVKGFYEAKCADGTPLAEAERHQDVAKRLALTTAPLSGIIGDAAAWSLGKTWHVITPDGAFAAVVRGFDMSQSGHHHYLRVHFAGRGQAVTKMSFRAAPFVDAGVSFDDGLALFVPRPVPAELRVQAMTHGSAPSADKLAALVGALAPHGDDKTKPLLTAAPLDPKRARVILGRFPSAAALFEVQLEYPPEPGVEDVFYCDRGHSIITFVNPTRGTLMEVASTTPTLAWSTGGNLGPAGFSGCGQVLARIPLGTSTFDAFIVEYPWTTGNDVILYTWDGARYVGRSLYGQGSG